MIHRIMIWCAGYVRIRIPERRAERFVNLCRNGGIFLWGVRWDQRGEFLFAYLSRWDYFRIKAIVEKTGIFPLIVERIGGIFWIQRAGRRASFWWGLALFLLTLAVLSQRIWGIYIEGESYHTKESMLSYLEEQGIYGGIESGKVGCSQIETEIRRDFPDIGWASIEKTGSKLYVRIQEVALVEEAEEKAPGNLVASRPGTVSAIVTSQGKGKVRVGDFVKKNQVLISGRVKIVGDNEEIVGKTNVCAQGIVVLQHQLDYKDQLKIKYKKRTKTKRSLSIYNLQIGSKEFFLYNPLNYLETYEKYDIIREGGLLCPFVSLRFPVSIWRKTFQEVREEEAQYSLQEAKRILQSRFDYYLEKLEKQGYTELSGNCKVTEKNGCYLAEGKIVGNLVQETYQELPEKPLTIKEEKQEEE